MVKRYYKNWEIEKGVILEYILGPREKTNYAY